MLAMYCPSGLNLKSVISPRILCCVINSACCPKTIVAQKINVRKVIICLITNRFLSKLFIFFRIKDYQLGVYVFIIIVNKWKTVNIFQVLFEIFILKNSTFGLNK